MSRYTCAVSKDYFSVPEVLSSFLFKYHYEKGRGWGDEVCVCLCLVFLTHRWAHTHTHSNSFHWLLILETHLTQPDENLQLLAFNIINIPNVIKSIVKMYIQWFYEAQDLQMYFRGSSRVLCSVRCWTTVENPGAHAWLLEPSRGF